MDKKLKRRIEAGINKVRANAEPGDDFVPSAVARAVLDSLSAEDREEIVLEFIGTMAEKMEQRAIVAAANQTGWFDLPEYQHIRAAVKGETLEQYRARITALEKRIESYGYARRAEEKLQRDEQELREMRALDALIAPFFANTTDMTVGRAIELYQRSLQSPARRQRREAGKRPKKRKWART